jgi:P4 family phage/plasmid primase-like protien
VIGTSADVPTIRTTPVAFTARTKGGGPHTFRFDLHVVERSQASDWTTRSCASDWTTRSESGKTQPPSPAARMARLFDGNREAHYVFIPGETETEAGKRKGEYVRRYGSVTVEAWESHLSGEQGRSLLVIPIQGGNSCVFGAIDIDVYASLDHVQLLQRIDELGFPLITCRSKSGGAHCYSFGSEPIPAALIRQRLREMAVALGYPNAEVFSKQDHLEEGTFGSGINVPYFNGVAGGRYAVRADGSPLPVDEFLDLAEAARRPCAWFENAVSSAASEVKGPRKHDKFVLPEVITAHDGDQGRNQVLYRYACSLRARGLVHQEILNLVRTANAERCKPPLDESEILLLAKQGAKQKEAARGSGHSVSTAPIEQFVKTKHRFAQDAGEGLYVFKDGVYKPEGRKMVQRLVKEYCDDNHRQCSQDLAERVLWNLRVASPELLERPPLDTINCKNGLLDVRSKQLRPHDPTFLSSVQINAAYDKDATCPELDKFCEEILPIDASFLMAELAAWLMLPDTGIQKSVLLVGTGGNGKSALLGILRTFLGEDNVCSLSLQQIQNNRFSAADLAGKLANVCGDLPDSALHDTDIFKKVTGEDRIVVERKGEHAFQLNNFARMVFSSNSYPRSKDMSAGFFERWFVVTFDRMHFRAENKNKKVPLKRLLAKLTTPGELSGLLNAALLRLPGIQSGELEESASTRAAFEDFRRTTDPLAIWLDERTVTGPSLSVSKDALRKTFRAHCEEQGLSTPGESAFSRRLMELRPAVKAARSRADGGRLWCFAGIGLKTTEPEPEPEPRGDQQDIEF